MVRRSILAVIVLGALVTACGGEAGTSTTGPGATTVATTTSAPITTTTGASAAVDVSGFAFHPADMTVAVGTTVTWTNGDSVTHTATSDTGVWSASLPAGGSADFTFDTPGVYTYHCAIHSSMTATITVTP